MKIRIAVLIVVLLMPSGSYGQTLTQHPDDPAAELIDFFQVALIPMQANPRLSSGSFGNGDSDCSMGGSIYVWRTSGGRIDNILDAASLQFTGSCCDVNNLSTADIFTQISRVGLEQGILLSPSSCPLSCSTPATARVYTASCVQRQGSCGTTTFTPCGDSTSYREYTYCCVNGVPVITELPGIGGNCTMPCEPVIGTTSSID